MNIVSFSVLYRRIFKYLRRYILIFIVATVSMMIVAATMPMFARLMKPLIDQGFVEQNMQTIHWLPLEIVGIFLVRGIFNFINEYSTSYITGHLVQTIRQELFAKLLRLPNNYYDHHNSGRVISRILNDSAQITSAGFNVITVLLKDGLTVTGLMLYLLYLNWKLTLISLIVIPVLMLCVRAVSKRLRNLSSKSQQLNGGLLQIVSESIAGSRVIKIYGGTAHETNRFNELAEQSQRNGVKQTAAASASGGLTLLFVSSALALILFLATNQAKNNDFSAGDFMAFLTAMIMILDPVKRMTGVMNSIQQGLAAAQSVFEFLDEPEEHDTGSQILSPNTGDIVFCNITHKYTHAERNSLNNFSLTVPKGKVYALVGASGCGKTTLVNLLPRFFDPTSGHIEIDGIDTKNYTMESLRAQISLVSQDVVLFDGTIAENIAYGAQKTATEEEIIQAAKAANAWEFIQSLPEGLHTHIGENGTRLSGGQRQRIAIARALLKNAPILILDEATSALDNESERLVQAALDNLMKNRTTIVIAHRLSTIEGANQIVVMHDGRIVEQGTHKELIQKGGRYADLSRLQAQESNH